MTFAIVNRVLFIAMDGPMTTLTVDATLKRLPAHFARQVPNATLLVQLHCDRVLMIAEKARKGSCERFPLYGW